jgi:CubicO group peptidase (beta-lactamase class C family)
MLFNIFFSKTGPGASIGIIPDDGIPLLECFGLSDLVTCYSIDKHTAFDLASIAKVFTSTAVLLLYKRDKLKLSTPVCDHISGMTRSQDSRHVAIQDFLWHTSGLHDYLDFFNTDEIVCSGAAVLAEKRSKSSF